MNFRKLEPEEHGKTKALYEEVFLEDTGSFADYYYEWKTRDNVIYVAEDEQGLHAMVQLNPYTVSVDGVLCSLHYIVAVATQKEYRHRGLMRHLLTEALQDMQDNEEAFTFLMPASEKIYLPFGFQYFSEQRKGKLYRSTAGSLQAAQEEASECEVREILPEQYLNTADHVNRMLARTSRVFIWRDTAYYKRLQAELAAMNGKLMGVYHENRLAGTFCMVHEPGEAVEIREVIADPEYLVEVRAGVQEIVNETGVCTVAGCPEEWELEEEQKVPLLMAKALNGRIPKEPEAVYVNEIV